MEPNCDFHSVSSTFGCTGKGTQKRASFLVNSTYSWASADPAGARIRAADTALRRMVVPLTCDVFPGGPTLDGTTSPVNGGPGQFPLCLDRPATCVIPSAPRRNRPHVSRA